MIHVFQLSFIIFAIWYTMQDGEIFGFMGHLFSRLPNKLHDPLFDCPVCMVPWYGVPITLFILKVHDPLQMILIIIPAMGLNAIILKLAPDKDHPGYHKELSGIQRAVETTWEVPIQWSEEYLKKTLSGTTTEHRSVGSKSRADHKK